LAKEGAKAEPYRLSAWLATQGFFIAAWSIWEYHSRILCQGLPRRVSERNKSHVQWVVETFQANNRNFAERDWFAAANALRNLIPHCTARAIEDRAQNLLQTARGVLPDLHPDPEGYVLLNHDHAAALKWKIGEFIRDPTAPSD